MYSVASCLQATICWQQRAGNSSTAHLARHSRWRATWHPTRPTSMPVVATAAPVHSSSLPAAGGAAAEAEADLSSALSLANIRQTLIRLEDTIIFSLIERAQFARNEPVYEAGAIPVPGFHATGSRYSLLEYLLREIEQVHGRIRRYTSPDEYAFFPEDLPALVLPPITYEQVLAPCSTVVNINNAILDMYLQDLLPEISVPGDDHNYGSSAMNDVTALQALSKRIHYGMFVAEAKFRKQTEQYSELIRRQDSAAILELLTDRAVELKVIERVRLKAATFGVDLSSGGDGCTSYRVQPEVVAQLYEKWIMPLTKEVEVQYLLRRLDAESGGRSSDGAAAASPAQQRQHSAAATCTNSCDLKKLLRKVDFLQWKNEHNLRELQVMRRYHIQDRDDYTKYNKLCGMITKLVGTLKRLDARDSTRIALTDQLLDKLYNMGVITTKKSLVQLEKLSTASFCRRRLSVVMVRLKMAETLKEAVTFIEQGHVRVGPDTVTDPAFLVTRSDEDFCTWTDSSKIKRKFETRMRYVKYVLPSAPSSAPSSASKASCIMDEQQWRVQDTVDYVCSRNFRIVTLQFPDDYLKHAAGVCKAVTAACEARGHAVKAYILADTTYNSLSVDEVAAAHIGAECVVRNTRHFRGRWAQRLARMCLAHDAKLYHTTRLFLQVHYGRASLTKLSRLPAFFVFPQQQLDVQAAAACLAGSSVLADSGSSSSRSPVLLFLDQPLLRHLEELKAALVQLVGQQQGAAAAARLVFPSVPSQHMEPQQQCQQAGVQPAAARGCCGTGTDCSSSDAQQQKQPAAASKYAGTGDAQLPQFCQKESCCSGGDTQGSQGGSSQASQPAALPTAVTAVAAGQQSPPSSSGGCGTPPGVHSLAGYQWQLPPGVEPRDCGLAWVGATDAPALLQLQLTYNSCPWAVLDPALLPPIAATAADLSATATACGALREGLPLDISRALRRRYFLVQKARDARIVGILVGTLGAAGYVQAVSALQAAARAAGKKTYTLLMGKPSPAKLANFPEIEVFVLVADPQGQILDSKEYLAPIITPHEAHLAFSQPDNEGEWDQAQYRLDFEGVLHSAQQEVAAGGGSGQPHKQQQGPRFSLVAGGHYTHSDGGSGASSDGEDEAVRLHTAAADPGTALALHAQQALQVSEAPAGRSDLVDPRSAADYLLHKRSWQGVEAPLVGAAPKAVEQAVEGRSGRAAGYGPIRADRRKTHVDDESLDFAPTCCDMRSSLRSECCVVFPAIPQFDLAIGRSRAMAGQRTAWACCFLLALCTPLDASQAAVDEQEPEETCKPCRFAQSASSFGLLVGDEAGPLKLRHIDLLGIESASALPLANPVLTALQLTEDIDSGSRTSSNGGSTSGRMAAVDAISHPTLVSSPGDHRLLMFFAAHACGRDRWGIAAAESSDGSGGTWRGLGMVAESNTTDLHAPSLFQHNGTWYLVPESGRQQQEVQLFRASSFPTAWQPAGVLISEPLSGVQVVQHGGTWWLVGHRRGPGAGGQHHVLCIFSSRFPFGPWSPHPSGHLPSASATTAGAVFTWEGRLHRLSRSCRGDACGGLQALQLHLSADTVAESPVRLELGPRLWRQPASWDSAGWSHLSVGQRPDGTWLAVVQASQLPPSTAPLSRLLQTAIAMLRLLSLACIMLLLVSAVARVPVLRFWLLKRRWGQRLVAWSAYPPHLKQQSSSSPPAASRPSMLVRLVASGAATGSGLLFARHRSSGNMGGSTLAAQGVRSVAQPFFVRTQAQAVGGQYSRFTLMVMSYDARLAELQMYTRHYSQCPSVGEILVVWNRGPPPDPSSFQSLVPVRVRAEAVNSMNNRFRPDPDLLFRSVLSLDDDILIPCTTIEAAFARWRRTPQQLLGFYPRLLLPEGGGMNGSHGGGGPPVYRFEEFVFQQKAYNTILAGAAFMDSATFFPLYFSPATAAARELVDSVFNCDDLLLNYVVANWTAAAAANLSRDAATAVMPPTQLFRPERRIDASRLSGVGISHNPARFKAAADTCLEAFGRIFNGHPLVQRDLEAHYGSPPNCKLWPLDCIQRAMRSPARLLAFVVAVVFVILAIRGRQAQLQTQKQPVRQQHAGAGYRPAAPAADNAAEKAAEKAPAAKSNGGWGGSYLHKAADKRLTGQLDRASKASPLMKCTGDLHIFKLSADELGRLNDGAAANRSTLGPMITGTAYRMPCRYESETEAAALKDSCCPQTVNFRLGTTDFKVFQQVFQYHYMRYLYTLFAEEPPQYILDAGANAGFSSMLFKLLWPNATVVSLEPDPTNFAMLKANTKQFKGVHALNAGLWSHAANITVTTTEHGNWGRVFREAGEGERGMPAYSVQDLATLLSIPAFDLVKIDIEGAEGMVFAPGGDFSWISEAKVVSMEIHDYFGSYFGLEEDQVSRRVDAAFNTTGYQIASDNEHVMYIQPQHMETEFALFSFDACTITSHPMTRFVVTGFGEFCGVDKNPTEALIKLLRDHLSGDEDVQKTGSDFVGAVIFGSPYRVISTEVLECAGQSVGEWAEHLYGGIQPETPLVVLHMGVDGTATHFKLEQQAVNEAAFRVPDQKGWQPRQQRIDDHPGLTLSSRLATSLDVAALAADLTERRHDARVSQDAGRYVCNFTYYLSLLHTQKLRQRHGRPLHTLFLHVPPAEVVPLPRQLHLLLDLLQAIAAQLGPPVPPVTAAWTGPAGLGAAEGKEQARRAVVAVGDQQAHSLRSAALQ
ncbi:Glycosyltransferase family protein 64 protein C5 [Chlorella vulgaris]